MTTRVQVLRSSTTSASPAAGSRSPGELYVNFADLIFGVIDASRNPQKLVAVRFFSTSATYAAGDCVVQAGKVWFANGAIPPGAFAPAQWTALALPAAPGNGALLIGQAGTVPIWLAAGATDAVLSVAAGTPAWKASTGTGSNVLDTNPAFSAGATFGSALAIAPASGAAGIALAKAASGAQCYITGYTGAAVAANSRWQMRIGDTTVEGAGNAGSDFSLASFDNSGVFLGFPFTITRATGAATFSGSLTAGATITMNGAAGTNRGLVLETSGQNRWVLLANAAAEAAGNAGSDLQLNTYDNTGAYIGTPLTIERKTGYVAVNGNGATLSGASGAASQSAAIRLNKGGSGYSSIVQGMTNGVVRWQVSLGDNAAESSNAGSDFTVNAFNDAGAGATVPKPLWISRSTGVANFAVAIVNGPSDRRLKENIAPLEGSLHKVLALQGVSYNLITTPNMPEIGLIAQDVQPIVPEIVQIYNAAVGDPEAAPQQTEPMLALDYPKLTALLIEAVKTLAARVEALEALAPGSRGATR